MDDGTYLLDMQGVDKSFPGVKALDQARLQVRAGTVHSLMGENGAGKSTLMKCLFGIYQPDAGSILISGKPVSFSGPKEAMEGGVSMVHQELNQVLKRNVMENLWLGRFPKRYGLVSQRQMYAETMKIFDELNIQVDPKALIGKLSVSQRQMVEIAKAVSYHAKILVLDEPTSSLTNQEVEHLFQIVNQLRDNGVGIVYISHKMEEILAISDDVTIMRDGMWIATEPAKELTIDKIIKYMVGRDLTHRYPPKNNTPDGDLL
ncbi:MAG: ATP-binding cassette domain-containing protein, partial [Planctomycetes bacterium]|nr:ATP-binding cassette domain-containing protein [Planctomycetota bacterium]